MDESPSPERQTSSVSEGEKYSPLPEIYLHPKTPNKSLQPMPAVKSVDFASFNAEEGDRPHTIRSYHLMLLKHFGGTVWRTRSRDFMTALVLSACTFLAQWLLGETTALRAFELALISLAGWLGIIAFGHLIFTPWLVHKTKETERAARHLHWKFGIIGGLIPIMSLTGITALGIWVYATRKVFHAPPLSIPSADAGAKDAEIVQLKQRIKELTPDERSLKVRSAQAADDFDKFFRERAKHQPSCVQTNKMTPEQQIAAIAPCNKYQWQTQGLYDQELAPRIMAIVEECRSKGMNVMGLQNCAGQAVCGTSISTQLRALSRALDAHDNVKR